MRKHTKLREDRLIARELERVAPNLALAKLISSELYVEMLNFYIEDNKRRKLRDLKDDQVYQAIEIVVEKLVDEEVELKLKDITDILAPKLFNQNDKNFENKKRGLATRLGSAFKNCTLFHREDRAVAILTIHSLVKM